MEQRTCNIIMCCKGHGKGESTREAIANYMSHECGCSINVYNESTLLRIVKNAFFDYLDTCDNPSMLLRNFFEKSCYRSDLDRIASAFSIEKVLDENFNYANGFNKEMINQSRIDLGDSN